jgi:hypothetical protein
MTIMPSLSITMRMAWMHRVLGMAMVSADHGGHHHDYYAKPYYNYEYGVEAYGVGYGHGECRPWWPPP